MANAIPDVNRRWPVPWVFPRALVWAATSAACCVALAGSAAAHPEWSPIRVNRYAKIVFEGPERVRLVYTILYGDGPALPARKSVDLDANGRIDERERGLLGARAQAQLGAGLIVTLDAKPLKLGAPTIDVGLAGDAVAPQPFSIDLVYALAAPGGAHTLTLDDHVDVTNEGDTEVSVDDATLVQLTETYQGRAAPSTKHTSVNRVFTFRGPRFSVLEDRTVTIRWGAGKAQPVAQRRWPLFVGLGALAASVLVALGVVRRARRSA